MFVEVSDAQISAAQQGLEIGKLQDPRPYASSCPVEPFLLQVNRKKHFLKNIFRFSAVMQDPVRNAKDLPTVAMKKQRETLRAAFSYVSEQLIVLDRLPIVVIVHFVGGL